MIYIYMNSIPDRWLVGGDFQLFYILAPICERCPIRLIFFTRLGNHHLDEKCRSSNINASNIEAPKNKHAWLIHVGILWDSGWKKTLPSRILKNWPNGQFCPMDSKNENLQGLMLQSYVPWWYSGNGWLMDGCDPFFFNWIPLMTPLFKILVWSWQYLRTLLRCLKFWRCSFSDPSEI